MAKKAVVLKDNQGNEYYPASHVDHVEGLDITLKSIKDENTTLNNAISALEAKNKELIERLEVIEKMYGIKAAGLG